MGPVLPNIYRELKRSRHGAHLDRELSKTELAVFKAAQRRSVNSGRAFDISLEDYKRMVAASNGRCEATKIRFSDERVDYLNYRPFRISIDRIDSSKGYFLENCQLVCAFFNMAKNAASVETVHLIALEYARAQGCSIPGYLVEAEDDDRWQY